ncbi:hypothetical protein BV898_17955 [Hypsibius exemplaris]|uniref:Uncharacterized protein n=1 Tax=Hypsibius exemplaris TaxID=2072580 RepID=A0A9X6NPL6_HYPEX|nr:hypothetical protein BV898_17955 [Hypsibius exemplaris]
MTVGKFIRTDCPSVSTANLTSSVSRSNLPLPQRIILLSVGLSSPAERSLTNPSVVRNNRHFSDRPSITIRHSVERTVILLLNHPPLQPGFQTAHRLIEPSVTLTDDPSFRPLL